MGHQTSANQALSEDWLGRTDQTLVYYRGVRDKFMPGKPFWNTETADAAIDAMKGVWKTKGGINNRKETPGSYLAYPRQLPLLPHPGPF